MSEFGFIRHGKKTEVGEVRKPLEESGLTFSEQEKWKEAIDRLKLEGKDPELAYEALPMIKELAQKIFESLPKKALVVFVSSQTPRNKLTTDFLSGELTRLALQSKEKDIAVAHLWEPQEEIQKPDSLVANLSADMMHLIDEIRRQDYQDDQSIKRYFEKKGNESIPLEDELTMKAANMDLTRGDDSYLRARGKLFRKQFQEIEEKFKGENKPLYFYGITHHSAMIALDAEFNQREKYNSVEEIPQPLDLWKANFKNQ